MLTLYPGVTDRSPPSVWLLEVPFTVDSKLNELYAQVVSLSETTRLDADGEMALQALSYQLRCVLRDVVGVSCTVCDKQPFSTSY